MSFREKLNAVAMEPIARAMAAELEAATGLGLGRVLQPVFASPLVRIE